MTKRKAILSLAVVTSIILTANLTPLESMAFAGYDDVYPNNSNNSSSNSSSDNGFSEYIYGLYIDEDSAVEVIQDDDAEEKEFTDLLYTVSGEQVTIVGVGESFNSYYYEMPSTIDGYPVVAIGDSAFKDCTQLVGLTVPNTVKSVGAYAFSGCTNLESIYFKDGVSDSNYSYSTDNGFENSYDNDNYSTTEETTTANLYGFEDTTEVTTTTDTETETEEETSSDTTTNTATGLRNIMEHAFDQCTSLSKISVPDSLTFMGSYAIDDTPYYTSRIEDGRSIILGSVYYKYVPEYSYEYEYNDLTSKYEPVVQDFEETIPDGIISIAYSAFDSIEGLTSIEMPESLKTIYDNAFANCASLTELDFPDDAEIEYVGSNAFLNTPWLEDSDNGFIILGNYLYKYTGKGGAITIPSKVGVIGSEAFALNDTITRVEILSGTQKIMGGAFYRCENLQTVVISKDVLSIGNQVFYGCKNLSVVTLNDGLLSIGSKCFVGCDSLQYIIIPDTVSKIGDMALGFDYDSTKSSYSLIDGFTIVGSEGSTAQQYAESKIVGFSLKENFTAPKQSKTYDVETNSDEEEEQPLDKKLIFEIIGGLFGLLILLSLGLYIKDRITNPKKYKKKRKKKKKRKRSKRKSSVKKSQVK